MDLSGAKDIYDLWDEYLNFRMIEELSEGISKIAALTRYEKYHIPTPSLIKNSTEMAKEQMAYIYIWIAAYAYNLGFESWDDWGDYVEKQLKRRLEADRIGRECEVKSQK